MLGPRGADGQVHSLGKAALFFAVFMDVKHFIKSD